MRFSVAMINSVSMLIGKQDNDVMSTTPTMELFRKTIHDLSTKFHKVPINFQLLMVNSVVLVALLTQLLLEVKCNCNV